VKRLSDGVAPVLLIAGLLAVWEACCRLLAVPVYFLPPPSAVARALASDAPELLASAATTLGWALTALAVVSLLASAAALLVAASPTLERAAQPLAVALQVTPIIAIAPLVVIWSGLEHPVRAIIVLASVVAFFPVFSGTLTGLKSADPDLERLFDLYGADRWQRLLRLRLPAAVPHMLEGEKVAAGQAVIGAVVAEFVARSGAAQGLAWRILEAGNRLETARMFAALFTLALMGGALYAALQALEKAALAWRHGRSS
jgi:NitT/TauT family transport system permease protein